MRANRCRVERCVSNLAEVGQAYDICVCVCKAGCAEGGWPRADDAIDGGRGKGGGVKLVKNIEDLIKESKKMFGMNLVTHQTGPNGKEVKRLYIEEASDISKEFYISCLVDRESSKIAFISSTEGGMDIEKVAKENPEKIITNKFELKKKIEILEIEKIIKPYNLNNEQKLTAINLIEALYKI